MSNPLITPDGAWIVGSMATAFVATGPAYLAAKRGVQRADHTEHENTRTAMVESLTAVVGPLNGRLDEMHAQLDDIRTWQAEHATEHAVSDLTRPPILEFRKR